jgi:hypothetical protein
MNTLKLKSIKKGRKVKVTYNNNLVDIFDSKNSKESFKKILQGIKQHGDSIVRLVEVGLSIDENGGYREFILYIPKNTFINTKEL